MTDKGLNIFDGCTAEYVHLPSQEEEYTSFNRGGKKIHTPGTTVNLQRALTEINKNDTFVSFII